MPLYRRLPKRGFHNFNRKNFSIVNLSDLQQAVDDGKISAGDSISAASLVEFGVLRRAKDGVRVLGNGELKAKLTLEVSGASQSAVKAIEAAGGSVTVLAKKTDESDKKGE